MMQEFVQQIEETAKSVVYEIHTALPGKIISLNPQGATAQIKPCGKYLTREGKKLEYPILTEVPLVFPFSPAAGAGIAFPVNSGDSCLVIFSEMELDEWRSGAEAGAPLRFDLTSAMAIPGLLSSGQGILEKACAKNAVVIRGNLEVEGSIVSSGDITGGKIYGHFAGE